MTARVKLFVTDYCPYCRNAERLLRSLGIPFEAQDVTHDAETRARLVAETGWKTVPAIFIGDELIGGFTDLKALVDRGELAAKVA